MIHDFSCLEGTFHCRSRREEALTSTRLDFSNPESSPDSNWIRKSDLANRKYLTSRRYIIPLLICNCDRHTNRRFPKIFSGPPILNKMMIFIKIGLHSLCGPFLRYEFACDFGDLSHYLRSRVLDVARNPQHAIAQ